MEATPTDYPQIPTKGGLMPKLYSSISDLPFPVFLDCYVDGDYSQVSDWSKIREQFNDFMGESNGLNISFISEIECDNLKYETIKYFIALLREFEVEEEMIVIRGELEKFGFPLYGRDYDGVLGRAESILMDIEDRKEQLQAEQGNSEDKRPDRIFFSKLVAQMSRYFKLPLHIKDLMTDEFCSHYTAYKEEANRMASQPMVGQAGQDL